MDRNIAPHHSDKNALFGWPQLGQLLASEVQMHPQNLGGMELNRKYTLFRSVSLNPRDISLFRSSRINSITVFGSMKAVEDMSAKVKQM